MVCLDSVPNSTKDNSSAKVMLGWGFLFGWFRFGFLILLLLFVCFLFLNLWCFFISKMDVKLELDE